MNVKTKIRCCTYKTIKPLKYITTWSAFIGFHDRRATILEAILMCGLSKFPVNPKSFKAEAEFDELFFFEKIHKYSGEWWHYLSRHELFYFVRSV